MLTVQISVSRRNRPEPALYTWEPMAAPSGGLIYSLLGCFSSVLQLNISFAHTSINQPMPDYVLGHTDLEQERLIR